MIPRKLFAFSLVVVLALFAGINQNVSSGFAQDVIKNPDAPLGTSITYQGVLTYSNDNPINGSCDFQFSLYDAASGGAQVGTTLEKPAVILVKGTFTVELDFGNTAFAGEARWLEVKVRCPAGSGTYTPLSPRQALTTTPYASYAAKSPWNGLTGVPAGFADNLDNDTLYTAGNGLTLSDATLAVNFGGDGTAATVSRSDHTHAGVYASLSHTHAGGDITSGTVADARIASTLARDSEIMPTVLASDGSGSTLDADSLDGYNSTYFATTTHGHWGATWTGPGTGTGLIVNGGTNGLQGESNSNTGSGVYGHNTNTTGTDNFAFGVYGVSDNANIGVGVGGLGINGVAGVGANGVSGASLIPGGSGVVGFATATNGNFGLYSYGNTGGTGSKAAIVKTQDYGWLQMYSMESPGVLFEDVGSAQLVDGVAVVTFDPKFAETVNLNLPYQVFVTPLDDCALYVTDKTIKSFTVRALGDAKCSLAFDYRIIAKRLGYEDIRMAPAVDPDLAVQRVMLPEVQQP